MNIPLYAIFLALTIGAEPSASPKDAAIKLYDGVGVSAEQIRDVKAKARRAFPGEIERSPSGELYVLDVINNRVQVLDQEGNFVRAFGQAGEGVGLFGRPAGLSLAPNGRVWVSDNMSTLIQSFTAQGEVKSVLGTAQDEWHFVAPRGIHFVGDRMYIVDRLSNKVVVFDLG